MHELRLIQDGLVTTAARVPDKAAIVDETAAMTYGEWFDGALRLARLLQDRGLRRGDRVALYLDNTVDLATSIYGVLLAGGVFCAINPQTKADKLAYIMNNCEASFIVAEGHAAASAATAVDAVPTIRGGLATDRGGTSERFDDFRSELDASAPEPKPVPTIPLDLAALIYTSGTTGRPKGVMLSHDSLLFCSGSNAQYLRLSEDDRILNVLPMAFTYGLGQLLITARLGCTLLLERSFAFPARTLERMRREDATVFPAVPTIFVTIVGLDHDEPYESVRCLTNAAAGLPPALHERIAHVFPNAKLFRMYGQTECQRGCYLEPELIARKPLSVGKAIPGTETVVLDDFGRPVEPGEVGILHIRGRHVMMGYWREPELTAEVLVAGPYPGERMLRTRDHFTVDEDGDLYFVDRSDDVIKSRGEKVSSVEVENALHDIPGVRLAAVVGVPDELLGQAIRAYVVRADPDLDERGVIRECRARLENFMVPREVVFVDELPKTESGKVRKKSLSREPLAALHISALEIGAGDGVAEGQSTP
jgi:amino acid adenylation domain-containing protein